MCETTKNNGAGERILGQRAYPVDSRTSDRPVAVSEHVVQLVEVRSSSIPTFNSRALWAKQLALASLPAELPRHHRIISQLFPYKIFLHMS